MATYTVKLNQSLYDVALALYGSIEGIFDLLITNSQVSMDTQLEAGMTLDYHEDFVLNGTIKSNLDDQGVLVANSERHVYLKHPDQPLVMRVLTDADAEYASVTAGGEGDMIIDWGDNSSLETVTLSHANRTVEHYFDSVVDTRRIKIYGSFQLTYLDASGLGGDIELTRPLTLDEYHSEANGYSLDFLFLAEGLYKASFYACTISDLLPLGDQSLMELDLRTVRFTSSNVVDDYLEYIVANYGSRRNCTVWFDEMPGDRGVAAMRTILDEEEWNKDGKWQFIINGEEYT